MARAPSGYKVRLEPQDEYTHVPDAARAYYLHALMFTVPSPLWHGCPV